MTVPRAVTRRWAGAAAAALVAAAAVAAVAAGRVVLEVRAELRPPRVGVPPGAWATPALEPVALRTADGVTLRGWYHPSRTGAAAVLVHGLGANRAQLLAPARALAARGLGVLAVDSRGHGESDAAPVTLGLDEARDVEAAVAWLAARPDVDPRRIGAVGFSVGSLPVAAVAGRDARIGAVALVAGFGSMEEMLRLDAPGWRGEVALAAVAAEGIDAAAVQPGRELCRLAPRPLLLVHGGEDRTAPPALGLRLAARACGPVERVVVPGADHLTLPASPALAAELAAFLEAALAPAPLSPAGSAGGAAAAAR